MIRIKALTISQPYASLIGPMKWIENRTWNTSFRGWVAIHAGKGTQYLSKRELSLYITGHVVKIARLAACVSYYSILENSELNPDELIDRTNKTWLQAAQHSHCEGPFCWILEDIRDIPEPIKINGKQGLWDLYLPDSMSNLLERLEVSNG